MATKRTPGVFRLILVLSILALFVGCGGGGGGGGEVSGEGDGGGGEGDGSDLNPEDKNPPAIISVTPADSVLGKHDEIVICFSESMDTDSLVLGGGLAGESGAPVWSQTSSPDDTVTIPPDTSWTAGQDVTFTLDGKDTSGNAVSRLSLSFTIPMSFDTFQAAELVIGQMDFTSVSSAVDAATLGMAWCSAFAFDDRLYIADYDNNRMLGYNTIPTENGKAADFVLGQEGDFTSNSEGTSRSAMYGTLQASAENGKMAIVDYDNNRVLVYNSIPVDSNALPDVVVGQSDFDSRDIICDAVHLCHPETVAIAGGKLIVTDTGHNRVLIWNSVPTENGRPADLVLGQGSLTTGAENDDDQDGTTDVSPSARTMDDPASVWSDGTRLIVNDSENNRVLIWNTFPSASFQPADIVLGQKDFTTNAYNDTDGDGVEDLDPDARTLYYPYEGVWSNGVQIFVADMYNSRVLIWNTWPESNFEAADVVLGQKDFTNDATTMPTRTAYPMPGQAQE